MKSFKWTTESNKFRKQNQKKKKDKKFIYPNFWEYTGYLIRRKNSWLATLCIIS